MESSAAEPSFRVYRASRRPIRIVGGLFLALGVGFGVVAGFAMRSKSAPLR
jgi:hypothetical protein